MNKQQLTTFPTHVLPNKLQHIIEQVCKSLGFRPDYFASAILLAISCSIGKTYKIKIKNTWIESAAIFLCLVGRPGSNKSHPMTFALRLLFQKTKENILASLKGFDVNSEDNFSLNDKQSIGQLILSNITLEAVFAAMSKVNIRLLIWVDELSGFFLNMNRYSKGSDIEAFLSIFSSQNIIVNRKTQPSVFIEEPIASMGGSTQPSIFREIFKKANGLIDRFLFVHLIDDTKLPQSETELDQLVIDEYDNFIKSLLELKMLESDNKLESNVLTMTPSATQTARNWISLNTIKINEQETDIIRGIYSKLEIYLYRFALILYIADCTAENIPIVSVDDKAVQSAIDLVEYFRSMSHTSLELVSENPLDALTDKQKLFYSKIRSPFDLAIASIYCEREKIMSRRNLLYFLLNKQLFKKVGTGKYEKLLDI